MACVITRPIRDTQTEPLAFVRATGGGDSIGTQKARPDALSYQVKTATNVDREAAEQGRDAKGAGGRAGVTPRERRGLESEVGQ